MNLQTLVVGSVAVTQGERTNQVARQAIRGALLVRVRETAWKSLEEKLVEWALFLLERQPLCLHPRE